MGAPLLLSLTEESRRLTIGRPVHNRGPLRSEVDSKMRCSLPTRRLFALAAAIALLVTLLGPGADAAPLDWDVAGGRFFTQTGSSTGWGYAVTDEDGVPFWSEFKRLGGVAALGYPVSQRFQWDGFTVQVFQRAVFQWRPEVRQVYLVNVFDRLHELGKDDYLQYVRQTPRPKDWAEQGLPWDTIVRRRLGVLDAWPALKARYYAVVGDAIHMRGLPTSDVVDQGNHYAVRTQRAVLQLWKENVPWARAGETTVALGGDILKELGVLPPEALAPVPPPGLKTPTPSSRQSGKRIVLGYYVPYDPSSWHAFSAQVDNLDLVAAQWVTVDPCGGIGSRDDRTLVRLARERGVRVLPSLLTSSGWLNHRLLTDGATTDRFLKQIVDYVVAEGYDGFDLDLEGVNAEDRAAYTSFVARLAAALHQRGKLLTLAVPPKTSDVRTGWAGAYDYAALGEHADLVLIMTYAYTWSSSGPGSTAPQNWVDRVTAYAASQIPRSKLIVGVAFYGYDWNVTMGGRAQALRYLQASALAAHYGVPIAQDPATRSATFSYTAKAGDRPPSDPPLPPLQHEIAVRSPTYCDVRPPVAPTPTPQPTPPPAPLQKHVVWLEDGASVAARLEIATRYNAAGIGAWRLGQEDPTSWHHLANWRQGG